MIAAERPQGSFTRQLSLGEGVDSEHLTAGYADGVLHVTIPASPKAQARRVEITRPAGGSRTISGSTAGQGEAPAGGTGGGRTSPYRISGQRAASRVRCWPPGRRAGAGKCRAACPLAELDLPAATGLDGHEAVILLFLQPRVGTTGRPVPDRRTTAATPAGTRVSSLAASGTTGRQRAPYAPEQVFAEESRPDDRAGGGH